MSDWQPGDPLHDRIMAGWNARPMFEVIDPVIGGMLPDAARWPEPFMRHAIDSPFEEDE